MVVGAYRLSSSTCCSSGVNKSSCEQGKRIMMRLRERYQRGGLMLVAGPVLVRRKPRKVTSLASPAPPPPARGDELLELTRENVEMVLDEV